MYTRKTKDEFQIQGYYPPYGWEEVTSEETRSEARARLKEYRENERATSFRMKIKRIKINN